MLADADRLQQTVEQVLKAGIAGQRAALQHRAPVDIAALATEVIETAQRRHHLPDETMTLSVATPAPAGLLVDGDVDELRTVLSNLLDNAVKYSRDDIHVAVEVAAPAPDTVWVRVKDRGVGIPRSQLKRIFNRFYRFQTRGFKVKGTGLGLYIVRSIVKQHGGRVFAASEGEGKGATFTVELPRLVAVLTRARRTFMARILLVEDEHHLAQGLCFNLEADGHEVTVAGDGEMALDRPGQRRGRIRRRDPRRHAARQGRLRSGVDAAPRRAISCRS